MRRRTPVAIFLAVVTVGAVLAGSAPSNAALLPDGTTGDYVTAWFDANNLPDGVTDDVVVNNTGSITDTAPPGARTAQFTNATNKSARWKVCTGQVSTCANICLDASESNQVQTVQPGETATATESKDISFDCVCSN